MSKYLLFVVPLYVLLAAFVWSLYATPAYPHEWYAASCCSGRDCAPIPASGVRVTPQGWVVTIQAGEHPFVENVRVEFFPWGDTRIRRSEDQDFHACILPYTKTFKCFYTPDLGS